MTAERHFGSPGRDNLARNVASTGRRFPSPWPRRLCVLAALAALGVALGLASGVVL